MPSPTINSLIRLHQPATALAFVALLSQFALAEQNWPQWRGPLATGASAQADPPVKWSEKKNIRWKTALPGLGHSTPIVWGERIFVTAALPFGERLKPRYSGAPGAHDNLPITSRHRFVAVGIDRKSGKILWQTVLLEQLPHEGGHYTGSLASASPVTDGRHVIAYFGSYGLYCLDFDGNVKWKKDLGKMQTKHGHGEGSSPVLFGDTLVVNWDHEGQSFVAGFETATGRQRWKVARDEVTSWATPIVVEPDGKPQVIVCGTDKVRAYDLATGKLIWECGGLSHNIVATPLAGHGMLFAGSSYEKRALLAIRLAGARGDITDTEHVAWNRFRGTPYVPSPLLYKESLYFLTHYQNILTRVDAKTGKDHPGATRLDGIGNIYASPVAAADRVYVTDLQGATVVLSHDERPRVLALNQLNDSFAASPALVDGEIILRGRKYLYSIARE